MPSQTQTMDIAMHDANNDRPLFDDAVEAIARIVQQEDHHYMHIDASSLGQELRGIKVGTPSTRNLEQSSEKFLLFVRTFAPYFDLLTICVNVRPEWCTSFWGLVRTLFHVSSKYAVFLEKIADMLETMSNILPPYHRIYEICRSRLDDAQAIVEDERLTTLMSYVYADLVQLFLDLYCIFLRDSDGIALRHSGLTPTPSAQWRPLDCRFSQLEARLNRHRKWLEKETESQVQDYTEISRHRTTYVDFLNRQLVGTEGSEELREQRLAKRLRRVDKVKSWLYSQSTTHARRVIDHQAACTWFLELPKYRHWKEQLVNRNAANDENALKEHWHDRVLFVQANPGFGKTVLSNAVIDDLTAEGEHVETDFRPPSTSYFHFNLHRAHGTSPGDAFRFLASQLLQSHRHDRATLDAVCLLLRRTSFREEAGSDEVLDVLSLLLKQHSTYLVIDGAEDCDDLEIFLTSLAHLSRQADVKTIVFSRPQIRIPLEYQKWASDAPHTILLDERHNAASIEGFVAERLNGMADQGYFGIAMNREVFGQVVLRAQGIFLWASCLLRYLESPILSPDERRAVLENLRSLESLETLYEAIMHTFDRRGPYEKRLMADAFRWLLYSISPLPVRALRAALTSAHDSPRLLSPSDAVSALPQLTCGLIEITDTDMIFSHNSIRLYLHSPAYPVPFHLNNEGLSHAHLAARCLTYLAYDLPHRPLCDPSPPRIATTQDPSSGASLRTSKSGDSGYKSVSSDTDATTHPHLTNIHTNHPNPSTASLRTPAFDANLPFLRYASLCWPIHFSRALSHPSPPISIALATAEAFTNTPYLPPLTVFLGSRACLTTWVEASLRYNLPPTLTRLVGPLADLKAEIPPATREGRELRVAVGGLRELSERLVELKRSVVGRGDPGGIWRMRADGEGEGEGWWSFWEG